MRTKHILCSSMAPVLILLALLIGVTANKAQDTENREGNSRAVRAFVTNFGGDGVSVVDPERGRLIVNIKTDSHPHGVAIAPDGRAVYVFNGGDASFRDWQIVVIHDNADYARRTEDFLWATWTRFNPASDIYARNTKIVQHHLAYTAPIIIDARMKPGYPAELIAREDIAELVGRRWNEYFPNGLN